MFQWIKNLFRNEERERINNLGNTNSSNGQPQYYQYQEAEKPKPTIVKIPVRDANPITKCDHAPESPRCSLNEDGGCMVCGKQIE